MSESAPAPTITRAASSVQKPRKLFVNIPVTDLQRSIRFFEALGFAFNPQFTDATATCMLVGEDAYVMLLTSARFQEFAKRPLGHPIDASFAITVGSRREADAMVADAITAGGAKGNEPEDHGFMYQTSFRDPDGYTWEPFWMDPEAVG